MNVIEPTSMWCGCGKKNALPRLTVCCWELALRSQPFQTATAMVTTKRPIKKKNALRTKSCFMTFMPSPVLLMSGKSHTVIIGMKGGRYEGVSENWGWLGFT